MSETNKNIFDKLNWATTPISHPHEMRKITERFSPNFSNEIVRKINHDMYDRAIHGLNKACIDLSSFNISQEDVSYIKTDMYSIDYKVEDTNDPYRFMVDWS